MSQEGMHGPFFVVHVRYLGFGGPIVAISGDEEGQILLREAGADHAVMKGVSFLEKLMRELEELDLLERDSVVLVLEDHEEMLNLIRVALGEKGVVVLAAPTAERARQLFREQGERIHGIIVDANVPRR